MNTEGVRHWALIRNDSDRPAQVAGDVEEINSMWLRPQESLEFDLDIPRGQKMRVMRARRKGVDTLFVHLVDKDF